MVAATACSDDTNESVANDGAVAEMTGTTSELPGASITELDGDFVGTVDGAEVFRTERLGGR